MPNNDSYQISREDLQLLLALASQAQQGNQDSEPNFVNLLQNLTPLLQVTPTIIESSIDIHLARAKNKILAAQIIGAQQYAEDTAAHIRHQDESLDPRDAGKRDWEIARNQAFVEYKQAEYDTNNAKIYAEVAVLSLKIINNLPQIMEAVERVFSTTVNLCKKAWNWMMTPKAETIDITPKVPNVGETQKIYFPQNNDDYGNDYDNCLHDEMKPMGDFDIDSTAAAA